MTDIPRITVSLLDSLLRELHLTALLGSFTQCSKPNISGVSSVDGVDFFIVHTMFACQGLVVCQVSRGFDSPQRCFDWSADHVDHNAERSAKQLIDTDKVFQMRPVPLSQRLWQIGEQCHVFSNMEMDFSTELPMCALIHKVIMRDAGGGPGITKLDTLNAFFVSGSTLHKIYVQATVALDLDVRFRLIQKLAEFLSAEGLRVERVNELLVRQIVLFDSMQRPWDALRKKIEDFSIALADEGRKDLSLNHTDMQCLEDLIALFSKPNVDLVSAAVPKSLELFFRKLIAWPEDRLFPILDIGALCMLTRNGADVLTGGFNNRARSMDLFNIVSFAIDCLRQSSTRNATLCAKLLCNAFRWDAGSSRCVLQAAALIEAAEIALKKHETDAPFLAALCTLLGNCVIFYTNSTKEVPYRFRAAALVSDIFSQSNLSAATQTAALHILCTFVLEADARHIRQFGLPWKQKSVVFEKLQSAAVSDNRALATLAKEITTRTAKYT